MTNGRAVDERRLLGTQECNHLGDLLGLDKTLDCRLGEHDVPHHLLGVDAVRTCLVGYLPFDQRSSHICRAHGVRGDPARAALQRDHFRKSLQPMFCRDVGSLVWRRTVPMHRRNVHDPAVTPLVHCREDSPHDTKRRLEHHPKHRRKPVRREIFNRGDSLETGVVNDNVRIEPERVDDVRIGQVDGDWLAPAFPRRAAYRCVVTIEQNRPCSGRRKPHRARPPDPASRSRNQHPPVAQVDVDT